MRWPLVKRLIAGTANDIMQNNIMSFAAALSYYFVMAFCPALIALAAVVGYLPIPNLFNTIINDMARVVPGESMGLIRHVVADVISPSRGALLSFGLIGVLWTCSSGFSATIEALNVAYDVPETRSVWKTRLLSLRLTFIVGTLVTLAFVFMIVGPRFGGFLAGELHLAWAFALFWPAVRYLLAITFTVAAVEILYLMAPNLKQKVTAPLPGAIVAVIGWIVLSDALSFYFRTFAHLNRTYGVLGGGVALLTWLYWSGFLILLGAEFNSVIIRERREGLLMPANRPIVPAPSVAAATTNLHPAPKGEPLPASIVDTTPALPGNRSTSASAVAHPSQMSAPPLQYEHGEK